MAKKKPTTTEEPEIVAGAVTILPTEEMPTALAEVKNQYGLALPDDLVNKHIQTYTPYFKQLVDMETELNALLLMEPNKATAKVAKELRMRYVKVRTGSKGQKDEDKAEILKEEKFLDAAQKPWI